MKEIKIFNTVQLGLEGYGEIKISEQLDGGWHIEFLGNNEKMHIGRRYADGTGVYFEYADKLLAPIK